MTAGRLDADRADRRPRRLDRDGAAERRRRRPSATGRERCASGSSSAAPTYRKNPAKNASSDAERLVRDGEDEPEQDAGDRRDRHDGDPAIGLACAGSGSASRKLTTPIPSLKRWMMTTTAMTMADPPPTARPAASATPSRKLWMPIPPAPTTPTCWWRGVVVVELGGGLVADVERRQLVDGVEGQEADRRPEHRRRRVAAQVAPTASGMRSKKAAPIRIPAPIAMMIPT